MEILNDSSPLSCYTSGLKHFKNKMYDKALSIFLVGASKQDSMSQFYLGRMFENGQGTARDTKQAYFYYVESGNAGCGMAQHYLGQVHQHGYCGMPKDYVQATRWFTKEFDKSKSDGYQPGHSYHLAGQIYEEGGHGISSSYNLALNWFLKAVDHGYAGAAFNIGLIYRKGKGVNKDHVEAINWFSKAALEDDYSEKSYYNLAVIFIAGGYGIERDFQKALDWLLKSVEKGSHHSTLAIGKIYRDGGYGIERNYKKALDWFLEAAKIWPMTACYNVGLIYRKGGHGVEINYANSSYWTMKGARIGHLESQYSMGLLYTLRNDEKQDFGEAFSWFQKAAENNHSHSQFYVGFFYEKGYGVKKNYENAMAWYSRSANNGQLSAFCSIGWLYYKGFGVSQDHGKAMEMYQKVTNMTSGALDYGSAFHGIGLLHQDGIAFLQSHETAMHYFLMAAYMNNPDACNSIGNMYKNGNGVDLDYAEAFKWYSKCAKLVEENFEFCDEGLLNLGVMYLYGLGTDVCVDLALLYLNKSLRHGNRKAQTYIDWVKYQHVEEVQDYQLLLEIIYPPLEEEILRGKNKLAYPVNHADDIIEQDYKLLNHISGKH